ncbi:MAG: ATP-binding protein [Pirellulaceae bacterium]|nr:ATP-binding protein [Pirellulaceae bacterium]
MTKVKQFIVQNFRQFEKAVPVELEPVTILVGANNSGKTAILQGMALFQYCLEKCMTRNGTNGRPAKWALKKTENVQPNEFGPLPVATPTDLWPQGKAKEAIRLKSDFGDGKSIQLEIKLQYNLFNIRPTVEGFDADELNDLLSKFAIRLIPIFSGLTPKEEFLVLPARQERQQAQRYGEIVRNLLFSLKKDAPERFELLRELLVGIYPDAVVDVIYDEEIAKRLTSARIESLYHDQILAKDLDLIVAGSGLHQVIQILAGMLQPGISLVLLDEPDAHLHARLQGALMRTLIRLADEQNLQFVIATHSPQLLRTAPEGSIRVCRNRTVAKFAPGPSQLELLDHLGVLDRMELVPLIQSKRVVFVENREDRKLIEFFIRKRFTPKRAEDVLRNLTFLYTYQEPISANVLDKARQVNDLLKDDALVAITGKSPVAFFSVGDRDYRTDNEIATEERELRKKSKQQGFNFNFDIRIWRRTEIENYLLDVDAMCSAVASDISNEEKRQRWVQFEPQFREFVQQQIMGQRDKITERLANRLQDRDRRQGLQAVMEKSRGILNQSWGDGSAWCDAKIVISSVRKHLQDNGFSPQSLSHPKIINSMRDIPDDVIKLVGKLASFSTTTEKPKKTNKPARRNKDKQ